MLRHVDMEAEKVHRYGNILGLPALRAKVSSRLEKLGLDTSDMEIVITAGISLGWLLSQSANKIFFIL